MEKVWWLGVDGDWNGVEEDVGWDDEENEWDEGLKWVEGFVGEER